MVDENWVRIELRTLLLAIPTLPTKQSWENVSFNPTDLAGTPQPWIRETFQPGQERLIATETTELPWLMKYSIFWPRGTGTKDADVLANAIRNAFKPKTSVDRGSPPMDFVVHRSQRLTGIEEKNWYHIPVEIQGVAYSRSV